MTANCGSQSLGDVAVKMCGNLYEKPKTVV